VQFGDFWMQEKKQTIPWDRLV